MFLLLLFFGLASVQSATRNELDKYTRVAYTTEGKHCLGGCSVETNECVVNWMWIKKPCRNEKEPAPIYYTSQVRDKHSKVCLSNCGKFGALYEWCVTTADNEWDYCSSHVRGEAPNVGRNAVDTYTTEKQICKSPCKNEKDKGYSCYINKIFWKYCTKQAISRVPTLPPDYQIGESKKQNCDAFLTNLVKESFRGNVSHFDSEDIPDNFLHEVADSTEAVVKLTPNSGVFKEIGEAGGSIKNYTMVNMILENGTVVLMPAVIHATISNNTIRQNEPLIDVRIMTERNRRRRQLAYDENGYFNWRIIGYELGGSDDDYNFIRQSPTLYESWLLLQRSILKWCGDTGGSVEMLIVVFYPDVRTTQARAIGAGMTFYNPDGSEFVGCKDTLYWNR